MPRFARAAAAVVVFAGALTFAQLPTSVAAPPDSFIVVYKDRVDEPAKTADLERRHGFKSDFRYQHAIKGFAAILPPPIREKIAKDPDVAFISPDGDAQAIGLVPVQANETLPTGALRIESAIESAEETKVHTQSAVNVAVIDTGVDLTHPDLNVVAGTSCIKGRKANDDNGHGTHVAGIIAAKNNGGGVIGVAPGTTIYAVKVLDRFGSGTWSQVICGIDWVTNNSKRLNIRVANLSLGGTGVNGALNLAIHNSVVPINPNYSIPVTYTVAAGNSGNDIAGAIPANHPEVVTVTAMSDNDGKAGGTGDAPKCRPGESDDKYATFSNYATSDADQIHTIAAPGVCIRSDWKDGGYNTISGTSMAAPHVAAVVALCITKDPLCAGLPADVIVQQRLRSDAAAYGFAGDPRSPVASRYYGYLVSAVNY